MRGYSIFCALVALTSPFSMAEETGVSPSAVEEGESESKVKELSDLVVVATRTKKKWIDVDGVVTSLTSDDLLKNGVQDVGGIVKYDPLLSGPFDFTSGDGAFSYGNSGYSGFNIRGVEGNRIAIELDGIRQPPQYVSTSFDQGTDGGSGGMGRDYFDPAMFDLVEIMKGGASALYGSDALGGVVSLRTLAPDDFLKNGNAGSLLRTQYFSANESLAGQIGGAVKQGDFEFMLVYAGRSGHETRNNGSLPPNPVDFDSSAILAKALYMSGPHTLRLTLESYERESESDVRSAVVSAFPVFDKSVWNSQTMQRQRVGMQWEYEIDSPWIDHIDSHVYWQQAESGSDNHSASRDRVIGGMTIPGRVRDQSIRFDTDIVGLTSIARKEFTTGRVTHGLLAGLDVSEENTENRFFRDDTGMPWEKDKISFAPASTRRYGFFIQDELKLGSRWTVIPGIRVDRHEIDSKLTPDYLARLAALDGHFVEPPGPYENTTLSPRFDVSYETTENTRLYASYARGIRNPTAEELSMIFDHPASGGNPVGSVTVPNPALHEETSHSFKLGFKADNEVGRFAAEGFYTSYRNYIENGVSTGWQDDDGRGIMTTLNRGKADIYGFEFSGEWKVGSWDSKWEGWKVGVSTGKAIGINRTDDAWLNSVDPWKTVGWLGYDAPSGIYGVRLSGIYTAAVTHVDDATTQNKFFRPPAWFTLDASTYWKPTETLTVNVGVNNLFNEKYWSWSTVRRGNGHLGGEAIDDRSTAPGTNFYLSLTRTF